MKITAQEKFSEGQRVLINGPQVFQSEDCKGTIIRVYDNSLKVWLDNGAKFYLSKHHCEPIEEHL